MGTYRGLLYVKHGSIGSRSEGPIYFLQTAHQEVELQLNERHPSKPDYEIEFFVRRIVIVQGDEDEEGVLLVTDIRDTCERLIGRPNPDRQSGVERDAGAASPERAGRVGGGGVGQPE